MFVLKGVAALLDAFPDQDFTDGFEHQEQIQLKGDAAYVNGVVADAAVERDSVASVELRQPGDAGAHGTASFPEAVGQRLHLGGNPGARSYEGHVSFQDVDQLGKFVQGEVAENPSQRECSLVVGKKPAILVAPVKHRFEFDDFKRFLSVADTRLQEKG